MGKHALLSASSSHRWLHCPPSARLCEHYEDKSSSYATEGTDAHTLCEHKLRIALGRPSQDPVNDLTYYDEEMEDCANGYAAHIMDLVETAKKTCADPVVLIEQRLDFSQYVQEGFGTGDCVVIADSNLHVVDYKYGQGVMVEASGNPQLRLYALGALEAFDGIYDIDTVSMTVYQPRRSNVSTHTTSAAALRLWAEIELRPVAALAYAGEGEYKSGEWCGFCKARHACRARAEHNLALAKHEFKLPPLLEDSEIEDVLRVVDELVTWATDVKEHALQAALSGKRWSGWKLVEGRSYRRYTSEEAVAKAVSAAGFDPYEKKVLGLNAMEKTLGKKIFTKLLEGLVVKPPGKPTLVPETDSRPAFNSPQQDFKEE
ncbi:MAG: hypothetical protein DDT39_01532 [Firmicutes bacterium]|nr:hypothetical protein [candidate division NPL-UPA2 bacterium]